MIKIRKYFVLIFILLLTTINTGWAQFLSNRGDQRQPKNMFGSSLFAYDIRYLKSNQTDTQTRVEVFVGFANDILQFVKSRDGSFAAKYEMLVSIFDKKGNLIVEKSILDDIVVNDFYLTNDRRLTKRHRFSFNVNSDKHKLIINLTDMDTRKSLRREKEIQVEGFSPENALISEVVFAENLIFDKKGQLQDYLPILNRKFINPDSSYFAYFELYPGNLQDSLKLDISIINENGKHVYSTQNKMLPGTEIIEMFLDLSKYINISGGYDLILNVSQNGLQNSRRTKFSVIWRNSEMAKINLTMAIKTLKDYIPSSDYKSLLQEPDSVKRAYLENFWEQRDPTPNTKKNELMDEFYKRVEFANNYFSVHPLDMEGWETDRGKIYIKYGPPEDVERHLDEINLPPYEIWYYPKIQRRFIFEDKSGMGDFRLVRIE